MNCRNTIGQMLLNLDCTLPGAIAGKPHQAKPGSAGLFSKVGTAMQDASLAANVPKVFPCPISEIINKPLNLSS